MFHISKTLISTAALTVLLAATVVPVTANAAASSYNGGQNLVYKTTLAQSEGRSEAILDWRNPSVELTFDMSDADWTDKLELLLSADPIGRVSRKTPLMIQFNNGAPTPLTTRGLGFDARILLEAAKIRPRNNTIRISYPKPDGAQCLSQDHGGWRLDYDNSILVAKARAKSRNYQLLEVERRLANSATRPKSVHILARGQDTTKLQVLAAQGIGLRMETLPEFKTTKSSSEFEVVIARRDKLQGLVTDKNILGGEGPRISLHEGRPMRLIITGDTDSEVMSMASTFASNPLPQTRSANANVGELSFQTPYALQQKQIDKSANISDLDGTYFDNSWGPKPKNVSFNVQDPLASSGEVLLRIGSSKKVSRDSRVVVALNGQALGFTTLNKNRKSVAFEIPNGVLQGTDNKLTITPELKMASSSACQHIEDAPGFYLGSGSKITINTAQDSPVAELSKLTATGAPFSIAQGAETLIVLPARSTRDYQASLKLMAKLAKTSGASWAQADFQRAANLSALDLSKNILFIGPNTQLNKAILEGAPKSLISAIKGQRLKGNSYDIATTERFAGAGAEQTFKLYAAAQNRRVSIRQGGVAALYPSAASQGKVIGIITNTPGRGFSTIANQLIKSSHWHDVEGSVARWNAGQVLMAQTAINVPNFKPDITGKAEGFSLPKFDSAAFEFGEIDSDFIKVKFTAATKALSGKIANIRNKPASNETVAAAATTQKALPKLRGFSKVETGAQSSLLSVAVQSLSEKISNAGLSDKLKELSASLKKKRVQAGPDASLADKFAAHPFAPFILGLGFIFLFLGLTKPKPQRLSHLAE